MKTFAASGYVDQLRSGKSILRCSAFWARSKDEAFGIATRIFKEEFPDSEWRNHTVVVTEVPEKPSSEEVES